MNMSAGMCSPTRGVWAGATSPSPSTTTMQYVSLQSGGDATDFGNLAAAMAGGKGTSNAHGGISNGGQV